MDSPIQAEAEAVAMELDAVSFIVRRSSVPSLWTVFLVLEDGSEIGYDLILGYKGKVSRHLCPESLLHQRDYH